MKAIFAIESKLKGDDEWFIAGTYNTREQASKEMTKRNLAYPEFERKVVKYVSEPESEEAKHE